MKTHRRLGRLAWLGFVFLAVANIMTFILTRHTSLSEHVVDPLAGFLHGVAIATLLLGLYRQTRDWNARCNPPRIEGR